jgi:ADP-heptose:LPS heptosyltransferase
LKEWFPERFQEVVSALRHKYNFVQIGLKSDPPLDGVLDMRGKTSLRQAAAIMSGSWVFVGLVGLLMHLARAVDCRSVIIFGGREAPNQSGYSCNENLFAELACSPCWRWSRCAHDRECMKMITADRVIEGIERQVSRQGQSLPVDTGFIRAT